MRRRNVAQVGDDGVFVTTCTGHFGHCYVHGIRTFSSWTYSPGHVPPDISPARTIPPPLLHGVGHFPPTTTTLLQSTVCLKQELSYRKQIARQLRTQYVEDIHRPKYYTVTFKSRLRVTQGHWKRNHWTYHTRLTVVELFDVKYYRDLEIWVRGHSRLLKVVPFESLGTVFYLPSMVTMAVFVAILEIFSVKKWPDLEVWVRGRSRLFKMARFDRPRTTFYWYAIVFIAPSCTILELFDVE